MPSIRNQQVNTHHLGRREERYVISKTYSKTIYSLYTSWFMMQVSHQQLKYTLPNVRIGFPDINFVDSSTGSQLACSPTFSSQWSVDSHSFVALVSPWSQCSSSWDGDTCGVTRTTGAESRKWQWPMKSSLGLDQNSQWSEKERGKQTNLNNSCFLLQKYR